MALVTADPVAAVQRPQPSPRTRRWYLLALLALATAIVGVLVPLAPVDRDTPVLTWPKAGQLPQNTLVPLVPYRPSAVTADVPCSALRDLDTRGGGEALRTHDPRGAQASPGLVVSAGGRRVRVVSGNQLLLDQPLPSGDCAYRVQADASGITVSRDGVPLGHSPQPPPQVEKLQTDLAQSPAGRGLQVEVRPDARFNSSPSSTKTALLVLELLLLAALLCAAVRRWRGARAPDEPGHGKWLHPADGLVLL